MKENVSMSGPALPPDPKGQGSAETSTGPSGVELLKAEFRSQFKWSDFANSYKSFLETHLADQPELRERSLHDLSDRGSRLEELEYKFADRVIEAYERWGREPNPVVLWDVDHTMGGDPSFAYGSNEFRERTGIRWGFRPCFLELINFLHEKFPNIRNGILSTRGLENLRAQLQDPKELGAIQDVIDPAQVYSAGRSHEAKQGMLRDFRSKGLNAMSIDDDMQLSEEESNSGTGIRFDDCPAFEDLCIVLRKVAS